jgi:copper chaperone CopZ
MKLVLWSMMATFPCLAQFQSMEITFEGIGCASCIASLPARIERQRGVESATVDAEHGTLKVQLAAQNRVRLEQVRDLIEQDGTKAKKAAVRVRGELSQMDGKWMLRPTGLATVYEVEGQGPSSSTGAYVVIGDVATLRPDSGRIVIRASELKKIDSSPP